MLEILTDDSPTLQQVAQPVRNFDRSLEVFCDQLVGLMRNAKGAGISAPQVGLSERIIVITGGEDDVTVMVNPKMLDHSPDMIKIPEGCLSLPGKSLDVSRPSRCVVEYYTPMAIRKERTLDLWESRVFQHELDHLNGILMHQRVEMTGDC